MQIFVSPLSVCSERKRFTTMGKRNAASTCVPSKVFLKNCETEQSDIAANRLESLAYFRSKEQLLFRFMAYKTISGSEAVTDF